MQITKAREKNKLHLISAKKTRKFKSREPSASSITIILLISEKKLEKEKKWRATKQSFSINISMCWSNILKVKAREQQIRMCSKAWVQIEPESRLESEKSGKRVCRELSIMYIVGHWDATDWQTGRRQIIISSDWDRSADNLNENRTWMLRYKCVSVHCTEFCGVITYCNFQFATDWFLSQPIVEYTESQSYYKHIFVRITKWLSNYKILNLNLQNLNKYINTYTRFVFVKFICTWLHSSGTHIDHERKKRKWPCCEVVSTVTGIGFGTGTETGTAIAMMPH